MKIKAAVLYTPNEDLIIETIDLDEPKDGEVLVRIARAGVCRSDLSVARKPGAPVPLVLGHEASGVVEKITPGVTRVKPGDSVILSWAPACGHCFYCHEGAPVHCETNAPAVSDGTLWDGTSRLHSHSRGAIKHFAAQSSFAEYAVVPQEACLPIGPDIPLGVAAIIGCAVTTGFGAAINNANVRPGQSVAIWGIGGVGISAILGAVTAGAERIIAIAPNPRKEAVSKRFGATDFINPAETNDVPAAIRSLTHGRGADAALECIGHPSAFDQAYAGIRPSGVVVSVGQEPTGCDFVIPNAGSLPTYQKRIVGSYYGGGVPERDFRLILDLYRNGKLDLEAIIGKTIALEGINDAFRELEAGIDTRTIIEF